MRKDLGLLLIRTGVGATVAAHGAQKLFGWFGGGGIDGTAAMFDKGGYELPLMLGVTGAGLSLSGPGRLSIDRLLGFRLSRPWMAVVGLGAAAMSAAVITRRRHAQLEAQQAVPAAQSSVSGEADSDVTTSEAAQPRPQPQRA